MLRVRQPHWGEQQKQGPLGGSRHGVFKDQSEAGITSGARGPFLHPSASCSGGQVASSQGRGRERQGQLWEPTDLLAGPLIIPGGHSKQLQFEDPSLLSASGKLPSHLFWIAFWSQFHHSDVQQCIFNGYNLIRLNLYNYIIKDSFGKSFMSKVHRAPPFAWKHIWKRALWRPRLLECSPPPPPGHRPGLSFHFHLI